MKTSDKEEWITFQSCALYSLCDCVLQPRFKIFGKMASGKKEEACEISFLIN